MPVNSPIVFYVNGTAYRLDQVSRWHEPSPQKSPPVVLVSFIDNPDGWVEFPKATFEAAMQACLNVMYPTP